MAAVTPPQRYTLSPGENGSVPLTGVVEGCAKAGDATWKSRGRVTAELAMAAPLVGVVVFALTALAAAAVLSGGTSGSGTTFERRGCMMR